MKKATALTRLAIPLVTLALSTPAFADSTPFIFNSKNGFYGGAEVGVIDLDTTRENIFEEFMQGTDVDFLNVVTSIDAYIDNNELRKCSGSRCPVNRITIDKNNTFSSVASFNTYFATIASNDADYTYVPVASLEAFFAGLNIPSHQVGLLDDVEDRAYLVRMFGGYHFKSFFGVEFAGFVSTDITTENQPVTFSFANPTGGGGDTDKKLVSATVDFESSSNLFGVEVLGKAHLPLHPFFGYVKAGVAYVVDMNKSRLKVTGLVRTEATESGSSDEDVDIYSASETKNNEEIRPVIGAGVGVRMGTRAVANVSYQHYERAGRQEKLDVIFLGVTLEFTDTMCGDMFC